MFVVVVVVLLLLLLLLLLFKVAFRPNSIIGIVE